MILYQPLSDSYNTSVFTHSSYVYSKKTARTLTPTLCETAVVRGSRDPRAVLKFHSSVCAPLRLSAVLGCRNENFACETVVLFYVCVVSVCPPRSTRLTGEVVARVQTRG